MTTWAIIPVKQLRESKQRLAHLMSDDERAALIAEFLEKLLVTLNEVDAIDKTLVVTSDPIVEALARRHGAVVLREAEPQGLNVAVTRGVAKAEQEGATAVLVLPADLPFARVSDIQQMVRPLAHAGEKALAALCSDDLGDGTNALLLAPPDDFTFHYGPGSFGQHVAETTRRGRDCHMIHAPGLRFDLDTESDWLVYNGYLVQVVDE